MSSVWSLPGVSKCHLPAKAAGQHSPERLWPCRAMTSVQMLIGDGDPTAALRQQMPIQAEHCSAMSSVAPGVSLGHVPLSLGWHTARSCTGSVERLLLLLNCVFCFLILTPVLSLGRGSIPPLGSQQYHGKAQIVFLHWPGEASHLLRCFLLVGCGEAFWHL